jgi:hypothetical protein
MDSVPLPKPGRWKTDLWRPFRTASGNNDTSLYDPSLPDNDVPEPDLRDLNAALTALVDIFPDVQPEVFREMLLGISEDSRLEVVTEHLLQKKAKWVKGRFRTPPKLDERADVKARSHASLPHEELFRSDAYKKAVKQVLYQEFRSLSHSTIRGVLAEQNFSYSLARPVLQQLASKSWRISLASLWSRKAATTAADGHPFIVWQREGPSTAVAGVPAVRRTGSVELDHELHELFIAPLLEKQRHDRVRADYITANELNEIEAESAEALFDCECCYSSVPFENIAACDGCHMLCLDCIRRTVNEALYGQGWSRVADLNRSTVRCFASEDCSGTIPRHLVQRALNHDSHGDDAWDAFQARMTSEVLTQSGLVLQRCPFCDYAEVNETVKPRIRHPMAIWRHIATQSSPAIQIIILSFFTALAIFTVPLLLLLASSWLLAQIYPPARAPFTRSLHRIHHRRRGIKFQCLHPTCSRVSCTRCLAAWRDPHACFESEKTSLRTAIEASATAAVKRTCPRCMLSFVKSSGCNKLVCNCGYIMCYVCRQEISSREGYAHFCQHFRPHGGVCDECERCDLYGDEDEEAAIRRAAETAERAWREKEGGKGGEEGDKAVTRLMIDALVGDMKREWYDEYLDAFTDALLV